MPIFSIFSLIKIKALPLYYQNKNKQVKTKKNSTFVLCLSFLTYKQSKTNNSSCSIVGVGSIKLVMVIIVKILTVSWQALNKVLVTTLPSTYLEEVDSIYHLHFLTSHSLLKSNRIAPMQNLL